MPRLDHRADTTQLLTPRERLLLDVLMGEINVLRQQLNVPVRTPNAIRQLVRDWLRAHPNLRGN